MRAITKKHYDMILNLLEKNRWNYGYGTIAPVDALLGDGDCLFFDFGAEYEREIGGKISNKKAVGRMRYILSLLEMGDKIESQLAPFYHGQVRLYAVKEKKK